MARSGNRFGGLRFAEGVQARLGGVDQLEGFGDSIDRRRGRLRGKLALIALPKEITHSALQILADSLISGNEFAKLSSGGFPCGQTKCRSEIVPEDL